MSNQVMQSSGTGVTQAVAKAPRPMTTSLICQVCQREATCRYVEYHQNIGALVIRFTQKYRGFMCKNCNRQYFWKATGTTFFLGWWGVISFFMTFIFLIGNVVSFFGTSSLPEVPAGAGRGDLDEASSARIAAQVDVITSGLARGDELAANAQDLSQRANVTPGQAWRFIVMMLQHQHAAATRK